MIGARTALFMDDSSDNIKTNMLRNAEELRELRARVRETADRRFLSNADYAEWKAAVEAYRALYEQGTFPYAEDAALAGIASGDPSMIEIVLCFLECRPYFFRSGYIWNNFLRRMRRANLSAQQADRLAAVIDRRDRWLEFQRSLQRSEKRWEICPSERQIGDVEKGIDTPTAPDSGQAVVEAAVQELEDWLRFGSHPEGNGQ